MIIDFNEKYDKKIVVALGYFETFHKGHAAIFKKTLEIAEKTESIPSVFTFEKSIGKYENKKEVFTFPERISIYRNYGVDLIIKAPATKDFFDIDACTFIETFLKNFNIQAFVAGEDYTYGKGKSGNIETLSLHMLASKKKLFIEPLVFFDGEKISSQKVRRYIEEGNIKGLENILGFPYFITGKVIRGRGDGNIIKYPTANIDLDKDKLPLKEGVYATKIDCGEGIYNAITNVGTHPTFSDFHYNIESHLLNFKGDLYGKEIKVSFIEKLRDIIKFDDKSGLINQLSKDIEKAVKILND